MLQRLFCIALSVMASAALAAPPKVIKLDFDPVAKAKQHVKDNCNDPAKLEFVEDGNPFDLTGCVYFRSDLYRKDEKALGFGWADVKLKGVGVGLKYRTANTLGAKVLRQDVFLMNMKGKVIAIYDSGDFLLERPKQRSDPFMDAFRSQFER